ncbi:capping complex subunit for YIEGIA [Bacillus sp. 1P06AnD]|uniref:capping complex subunit for YIEGIA n=1 Tax=Bacillus sp. 1P06AnD TaxID=3132208 RepID=UPI0039A0A3B9
MVIEKFILAVVTTDKEKVPVAQTVFHCGTIEEMDTFAVNLEAILDGIAHKLSEDVYIIVKH